jgi:hypothetical protein
LAVAAILDRPDQYRATIMIATTMNAAISESARSNDLDRGFAISASNGGITRPPSTQLIAGPAFFGKDQPLTVRNASKQAGFFERVGPLRAGRHPARFLKGIHRACILAAAVRRGFLFHGHILFGALPRSVEVGQREPSAFVGIFGNWSEATSFTTSLRPGSDGFGFELIRKRNQPSLYLDVTGHKCKLAALLDLIT